MILSFRSLRNSISMPSAGARPSSFASSRALRATTDLSFFIEHLLKSLPCHSDVVSWRLRCLLDESVKNQHRICQLQVIENSIGAGAILDPQLLYACGHRRHWSRHRHRDLFTLLQIKDGLA